MVPDRTNGRARAEWLILGLAVACLGLPVLAGLIGVLLPSFGWLPVLGHERLTLAVWHDLLATPGLGRMVWLSLFCGLGSALIAFIMVMLFLAGSGEGRLYRLVMRLISPLLSVPHAATALALAMLIAPSGLLFRLVSPWATGWRHPPDLLIVHDPAGLSLLLGLVLKEVPFLLLMAVAGLNQVDAPGRLRIARTLGYRPVTGWIKVVAPALYPRLRLPIMAVIAYASSTVDMAIILGPNLPPPLSVAILRWLHDPDLHFRLLASAGAVLQLLVTLLALAVWLAGERLVAFGFARWCIDGRRWHGDAVWRGIGRALILLLVVLVLLGLTALALHALAGVWRFPALWPHRVSGVQFIRTVTGLWPAIGQTLLIALAAMVGAGLLALAALENEWRRGYPAGERAYRLLYLPLIVPQVAFLFGLVSGFDWLGIRPGFWPVVWLHLVFVLPYFYLSLEGSYRRLDRRWEQVALSLGHGRWAAFWRVRLPLLTTPLLTAMAVAMAVSIGLYLPTLLIGAGRVVTVTTEAVAVASGGDRRVIAATALMQALLPFMGFSVALLLPRLLWRGRRRMRSGIA